MQVRGGSEELIEIPGQDSFLDVITNIVGILILLVLVVGMRTSHSVANAALVDGASPADERKADEKSVGEAYQAAVAAQSDVRELARRAVDVHGESQLREQERRWLATFVAAADLEVSDRRERLSADQQRNFDVRRQLLDAQQQLDDLGREHISLLSDEPETEVVESLPTPLAKTVSGQEVHLRLAYGQVAVVPFDELQRELETHLERNVWRVREQGSMEGTVGPINGFRLRYRIQLTQVSVPNRAGFDQVHNVPKFKVEFLPTSPRIGEPVDQAVLPSSELVRALKRSGPAATTVTVWTYPDSFKEFRQLKKMLFEMGFAAAGRPLPDGVLIGASPTGTKSAAQ
ncbi:MAG: hypothetical protein WD669_05945 [Pirellulales bacterium]